MGVHQMSIERVGTQPACEWYIVYVLSRHCDKCHYRRHGHHAHAVLSLLLLLIGRRFATRPLAVRLLVDCVFGFDNMALARSALRLLLRASGSACPLPEARALSLLPTHPGQYTRCLTECYHSYSTSIAPKCTPPTAPGTTLPTDRYGTGTAFLCRRQPGKQLSFPRLQLATQGPQHGDSVHLHQM
jgi:hypothetical protein